MRYGMVINLKRCVGCDACTVACKQANGTPPGVFYSHVSHIEKGIYPNGKVEHTPILCMHCSNPVCVTVCPTKASHKNEDGTVTIDQSKCIGCRQCIASCPYDVRNFISEKIKGYYPDKGLTPQEQTSYSNFIKGKVYKCDFCRNKRLGQQEEPVCVQTCPAEARIFGDLDDPNSNVSKLVAEHNTVRLAEEFGTQPSVYYIQK
ncbi:MAG: 4Fe-4S dicluster domain-containing protein [Dehalobacter sp. 4CP]|uniref:4Fe-4S dicluster domain-containing protein n=1 Tax=Dehalobacter sp. CP TaxID=2594474 RepID=UPI0013CC45D1|nr:4Fe-4S dicluster domain-containing protein [Dehalobacter sp. 4CP]